jgi:prevent-host-death family protein
MRTVNIGELKNQLSSYLQHVRNGEEIVIRDRSTPIARILPFHLDAESMREQRLVASGAMRMPEEEMNWNVFFNDLAIADPGAAGVPREAAIQAVIDSRGDR